MSPAIRSLGHAAALVLSRIDAYKVRTDSVYQVPEADRLSDKQLFARDADILSNGLAFINLHFNVPGRVYIRYVANDTAVAAGLLGKLQVSGDTRGAVEYVYLPEWGYQSDLVEWFSVTDSHSRQHNTSKTESLLVDVEFYQKNVLKQVTNAGSADVMILSDVIYAMEDGAVNPHGTDMNAHRSGYDNAHLANPGRLFLSDPTAHLVGSGLSVITVYGDVGYAVQLDVASINSTDKEFWVYAQSSSNVTIFASDFVSSIFMTNTTSDNTPPRKPLCVATKDDVNLTAAMILINSEKYTVIPGGTTCNKLLLPPREPVLIRDNIDGSSQYLNDAKTATPPPASRANHFVWKGVLAGVALVLSSVLVA